MVHGFDIEVAKEYGVNAAVVFHNIMYWCEYHRANGKHFYDGYFWVYGSIKSFCDLFPYLTSKQISVAIKRLLDGGMIVKGNYNEIAYNRTLWYAVTEKGRAFYVKGDSIYLEGKNHLPSEENGSTPEGEPIPNIKDNNIKTNIKNNSRNNIEPKHTYGEYGHVRLTDKEREKLFNYKGQVETLKAIRYLDEYIEMKGYKANSHYLAIRKWVYDAVAKEERKTQKVGINWDEL